VRRLGEPKVADLDRSIGHAVRDWRYFGHDPSLSDRRGTSCWRTD
jgi:hypothetical protein